MLDEYKCQNVLVLIFFLTELHGVCRWTVLKDLILAVLCKHDLLNYLPWWGSYCKCDPLCDIGHHCQNMTITH